MTEEFERAKKDIMDFNTCIKSWNLEAVNEDEADQLADLVEETMLLLSQGDEDYIDED